MVRRIAIAVVVLASAGACSEDAPAAAEPEMNGGAPASTAGQVSPTTAVPAAGASGSVGASASAGMGASARMGAGASAGMGASAGAAGSAAMEPVQAGAGGEPADPAGDPAGKDAPPAVDVMGGRIYWLDILGNGVYSALADGSGSKRIAASLGAPDGIGVDDCTGDIYFSNMGSALGNSGRASVQRARWDGSELRTLVEPGSGVNTAKQLTLDLEHGHVYFADREGAKVWRMKLDGSERAPVVSGHDFSQLVGVAVDSSGGHLYFTDRNRRLLLRAGLELPAGQTAANRDDIETLVQAPNGAMPIDLALDVAARHLYWTDRGLGTVQRIGLDLPAGADPSKRSDQTVVIDGLADPIGISLDLGGGRMYVTESNGNVHRAALDGSGDQVIAHSSSGTGIAFALIGPNGEHRACQ